MMDWRTPSNEKEKYAAYLASREWSLLLNGRPIADYHRQADETIATVTAEGPQP